MSEVIQNLEKSSDPLERHLAKVLKAWQNAKQQRDEVPRLGYEPRDINKLGAVEVIARRVKSRASGFDEVDLEDSYEALVDKYPDRFSEDVVAIARSRIA
jgi:hypothetical protein